MTSSSEARSRAQQRKRGRLQVQPSVLDDAEPSLEEMLEETLRESEEDEVDAVQGTGAEPRQQPTAGATDSGSGAAKASANGAAAARASRAREAPSLSPSAPAAVINDVQGPGKPAAANFNALAKAVGVEGSAAERATQVALQAIGYSTWDELAADLSAKNAGDRNRRGKSAEVTLANVLNRSSPVYHGAFAKAYPDARKAVDKLDVGKRKQAKLEGHSSLVARWSALNAGEHAWYLRHEGQKLAGSDAERFAMLRAKVEAERKEYWASVHAAAARHRKQYEFATERQTAQLLMDAKFRRQRTLALPRFYTFLSALELLPRNAHGGASRSSIAAMGAEAELRFVRGCEEGQAPMLRRPHGKVPLPGNKLYLPATVPEGQTAPTAGTGVYRKVAAEECWMDEAFRGFVESSKEDVVAAATAGSVVCLLTSGMLQHTQPWEIPIVVECSSNQAKRIFMGKPLPARTEMLRQKQRRLQKYAVLSAISVERGGGGQEGVTPRRNAYNIWAVGGCDVPLVVRSHGRVLVEPEAQESNQGEAPPAAHLHAVFAVKTEYLPEPDVEEDTVEALVSWWSKLKLNMCAEAAAVARVDVPHSSVLDWRILTQRDIKDLWGSVDPADGVRCLAAVLQKLKELDPGQYLLTHAADASKAALYKAAAAGPGGSSALPLARECPTDEGRGILYDLHAAHATSGDVDAAADPFVPPKWRPFSPDVAQVPYTFPPS